MAKNYPRWAHARYENAVHGGAISTITLSDPYGRNTIPAGAIILGGTIDIITQLAGASATIAVGTTAGSSTTAIKGATAVASWTVGQMAVVPVFTAATYVKMTASGSITCTIATTALSAGEFEVHLLYVVSSE